MENVSLHHVSTEKLKQLQIYDDYMQDPLFHKLMQVCSNDNHAKAETFHYMADDFGIYNYLQFFLQAIIMIVYLVAMGGVNVPNWFYGIGCIVLTVLSCVFAWFCNVYSATPVLGVIEIILIIGTFLAMKKYLYFYVFLIGLAVQTIVRIFANIIIRLKTEREIADKVKRAQEVKKDYDAYEQHYNKTMQMIEERKALCETELRRRGVHFSFENRKFWWENDKTLGMRSLPIYDVFKEPLLLRHARESTFEYKSRDGSYQNNEKTTVIVTQNRNFFMKELQPEENAAAIQHIRSGGFYALTSDAVLSQLPQSLQITAISRTITWKRDEQTTSEKHIAATQDELDDARRKINAERDAEERYRNYMNKGVAMTTKEIEFVYPHSTSWQEQAASRNIRERDMERFERDHWNRGSVSTDRSKSRNEITETFVYVVNGFIFYTYESQFPLDLDGYNLIGFSHAGITQVSDEMKAAIGWMMAKKTAQWQTFINDLWTSSTGADAMYPCTLESEVLHSIVEFKSFKKIMEWG